MLRSHTQPRADESNKPRHQRGLKVARPVRKLAYAGGLTLLVVLLAGAVAVAGTLTYTIQYGDTLSELAEDHGTDVDTLVEMNGIADPDLIITGDPLLIPNGDDDAAASTIDVDGEMTTYVIQAGDTLYSLARSFDVSLEDLIAWNDIVDPELIVTGDELLVPTAGYAADTDDAANDPTDTDEPASDAQDDNSVDGAADTDQEVEDPTGDAAASDEQVEPDVSDDLIDNSGGNLVLHLVLADETLESIAEQYGITVTQLTAANHHASDGVSPGMILKIPPSGLDGARITGMPAFAEQWPLLSELAAVSVATLYWGAPVTTDELLTQLAEAENPHEGFRGNPQGMFGETDDYGVYSEPLVDALAAYGYVGTAFYSDGDTSALTSWIDSGVPVIVWVTYQLAPQERAFVESEAGLFSLIPEQHALLVYGYDAEGIEVVDVSDGAYKHLSWDEFISSWSLFDGMSLAVAPA